MFSEGIPKQFAHLFQLGCILLYCHRTVCQVPCYKIKRYREQPLSRIKSVVILGSQYNLHFFIVNIYIICTFYDVLYPIIFTSRFSTGYFPYTQRILQCRILYQLYSLYSIHQDRFRLQIPMLSKLLFHLHPHR